MGFWADNYTGAVKNKKRAEKKRNRSPVFLLFTLHTSFFSLIISVALRLGEGFSHLPLLSFSFCQPLSETWNNSKHGEKTICERLKTCMWIYLRLISEAYCSRERCLCDLRALEMSSGDFSVLSNETAPIYTQARFLLLEATRSCLGDKHLLTTSLQEEDHI